MPEFVFSMPAQVVVDGINLSLVSVLGIQLLFTAQYHFPFSRKNYCLQLASVIMLMISVAVHLNSILDKLNKQSHQWPYMFAYIGIQMPPQDGSWSVARQALYLLMRAISIALVHLTHIQFLTLLYPSALEARLIFWMLGPLALVASGMEFTALAPDDDYKTSDLGDSIRNICNSALFMLYTSALIIWGTFINRRRAWRTDGGTAAFGGGSVGLAVVTMTISFIEIAYDRLWWLPDLCWTLTIWQSWLGFWWWVGAGMGIGEVEDRAERQERRLRRVEKMQRRREREERHRQKAQNGASGSTASAVAAAASGALSENSDAILGGMRRLRNRLTVDNRDGQSILSRRSRGGRNIQEDNGAIEMTSMGEDEEVALTSIAIQDGPTAERGEDARTIAASSSDTQATTSGATTSTPGWMNTVSDFVTAHQPNFITRRMRRLRLAHVEAARKAATEQSARREQVLNRQSAPQAPGLRTMIIDNRTATNSGLALPNTDSMDSSVASPLDLGHHHSLPVLERDQSQERLNRSSSTTTRNLTRMPSNSTTSKQSIMNPLESAMPHEGEWVDEEAEADRRAREAESEQEEIATSHDDLGHDRSSNGPSWSWRGPLRSLRMRDKTTYE